MIVTNCCGQLLPESDVLKDDVHYIELCPSCRNNDGSPHESHYTCKGDCPGSGWTYQR